MGVLNWVFGSKMTRPAHRREAAPPNPTTLPQPQAVTELKAANLDRERFLAQMSSDMPVHLLQHVFVFASGDPHKLIVLPGALEASTGATMDEINKLIGGIHFI